MAIEDRPRKIERKLTEGYIQSKCVEYARDRGFWARKFSSPAQRSVPDYLFSKRYAFDRVEWAEEFKGPGKTSTEAQLEEQAKMTAAGWEVIKDTGTNGQADIDAFKRRINNLEAYYS